VARAARNLTPPETLALSMRFDLPPGPEPVLNIAAIRPTGAEIDSNWARHPARRSGARLSNAAPRRPLAISAIVEGLQRVPLVGTRSLSGRSGALHDCCIFRNVGGLRMQLGIHVEPEGASYEDR
jgi:hypothetical protein